ncbi:hypothetical protein CN233_32010 [Sinorhizobium meliloti]|uniref:hypothetical protein n=1 Tax=Rhizobium meliloti TaxID=382 RepID=UPI0001E4D324|nr:hypothetical protein [Sinorhizobium meliloti]AEG52573.1 hypothetical protein Sinme_0815 [Sinorhizobium meliloti AK83]MDE4591710.1 hypothetical protein [Sinorhizobium meliloti]RVG22262.1 hypothetical protein CN233_32010 [Sinorhizobium meliloti]RVK98758.1 hypothetical protein CN152_15765 [Sinorhizobium meliloti]RVN39086.1 hypothetical protein CN113_28850 [Sinorhizobium meliloti]
MAFKLQYSKENAEAELGTIVIAYHEALAAALKALAEEKGTEDLAWFDELHQHAVKTAKGTSTEGIPIEVDARSVRLGFETLDQGFKSIRVSLLKSE